MTPPRIRLARAAFTAFVLVSPLACSSAPNDAPLPTASGGLSSSGGLSASGGATTGGTTSGTTTGGVLSGGSSTGGIASGGVSSTNTGGTLATGGAPAGSTGGNSLGGTETGGVKSSGGQLGTGGSGAAGRGGAGGGVASVSGGQAGTTATSGGGSTAGAGGKSTSGGAAGSSNNGGGSGLGGGSLCANGTFILCESFESTAVGAVPTGWTRDGTAQLVQVASDQAARGQHALKLGATASGPRRLTRSASDFGAAHWGRLFYRVQTPPPLPGSNAVIHSTIASLQGTGPNIGSAEYRVVDTVENSGGMHQYLYNVQPSGSEFGKGSAYNYKYDGNWHCAEWNVDATTQSYKFYVDGTEVTQIAINNGAGNYGSGSNRSELPMSFGQFKIGWYNYQSASPGFVAWIDEVAIASARIGCAN